MDSNGRISEIPAQYYLHEMVGKREKISVREQETSGIQLNRSSKT